jgi:hypothetical protein
MESLLLQSRIAYFDSYFSRDLMFTWAECRDERPPVPYRLVQLFSEAPAEDPTKLQGFDALREMLDSVLPFVCFLEAISRVAEQVEDSRIRVYHALTRDTFLEPSLHAEMKLNDRLQTKAMFVSRLTMELDDASEWLRGELQPVRDLMGLPRHDGESMSLADALERSLKFHLDHVRKHLDLVANLFANYIARKNVAVMYRLQWQVLLLTVVATVIAVGASVNWTMVQALLQYLHLMRLPSPWPPAHH